MRKFKLLAGLGLGIVCLVALASMLLAPTMASKSDTFAKDVGVYTDTGQWVAGDTQTKDIFALAQRDKKLTTTASQIAALDTGTTPLAGTQAAYADKKVTQLIATEQSVLVGDRHQDVILATPAAIAAEMKAYTASLVKPAVVTTTHKAGAFMWTTVA